MRDPEVLSQWAAVHSSQGRYVWLTPHGPAFLVDHLGTRRIDPDEAQSVFEAPPGADLYFT